MCQPTCSSILARRPRARATAEAGGVGAGGGVPVDEVRPDEHELAGAEAVTVGDGLGDVLAVPGAGVGEGTHLLGDGRQLGGDGEVVQARYAQDARTHAELHFGRQQGLEAGVLTLGCDAADDLGGLVRFLGGIVGAFAVGHAHHNGDGAGLVSDGVQAAGQGAQLASFAGSGEHVGEQDRGVEREGSRVGVAAGADHAHHGGGDSANGADALVDFEDANAVMVVGSH